MPKHEMRISANDLPVKRGGIELGFMTNNEKFGRIKISNATITWYPKDAVKGYSMSVEQFAEWAEKNGTKK